MVFFFKKRGGDGKKPATAMGATEPTITIVPPAPAPQPVAAKPVAAPAAPSSSSQTPPLSEWAKARVATEPSGDVLIALEGTEQGVHSLSSTISSLAAGRTVHITVTARAIDRPFVALILQGDTAPERAQGEIIADLQRGAILRSNTAGDATIVSSAAARTDDGWAVLELKATINDPAASAATVTLAVRKSPNGSTAYQGEGLKSVEIKSVRIVQS